MPASKRNNEKGVLSRPAKTPVRPAQKPTTSPQAASKAVQGRPKTAVIKAQPNVARSNPIPHAPKTTSLKMPKMRGKNSGELIQKRLRKQSPWFSSIADPLHGAGCKIPDEVGVETGTFQLVQRGTFTIHDATGGATASGMGGIRMLTPYINKVPNPGAPTRPGGNFQYLATDAIPNELKWVGSDGLGSSTDDAWTPFDGAADISDITNRHRIVSATLIVQPEPSLSNNEGEVTMGFFPFTADVLTSGILNVTTYDSLVNNYKAVAIPVNSNKAMEVSWVPFYLDDLNYKAFFPTNLVEFQTSVSVEEGHCPLWALYAVAKGCHPDTTMRWTMVVNYEFVPRYNTLNILGATPSPQDAVETELVETWVQDMDVVKAVPQAKVASSPSVVKPSHDDDETGFGMFFNVLRELVPLAVSLV